MTYVRVPVPRIPAGLGSNLLGVAGLVAVVVAVGMLAGAAWAVLTGGLLAVGLAAIGQAQARPAPVSRDVGDMPRLLRPAAGRAA